MQQALDESQNIFYSQHPLYPARDLQSRIQTETSGLILTDNDRDYLGKPYQISLHNAHKSGYVDADSDQVITFGMLTSVVESIRMNGGQVERDRRVIDHVSKIQEPATTQTVPGDASFDRRSGGRARTILLTTGTDAEARRVATFDGTGLPVSVAMRLAYQRLARLNDPPEEASVELAYVEPSLLRRGVDLNIHGRTASLGTFLVRNYSARFTLSPDGFNAEMSIGARELQP
jgi:hypothetical protein